MSLWKKIFGKRVDERQELELLRAEHNTYWITFWLLFAVVVVEQYIFGFSPREMAGEFVVFMISAIALCVECTRRGLWNYQHKKIPGVKSYLLYSLGGALLGAALGIFNIIRFGVKEIPVIAVIIGIPAVFVFITCFICFLIMGSVAKSKEKKLAEEAMQDEDEDEE